MLKIDVPSLEELRNMSNHDLYFHYYSIKNQFEPLIENMKQNMNRKDQVERRKVYKKFYSSLMEDTENEINNRKASNSWGSGWGI